MKELTQDCGPGLDRLVLRVGLIGNTSARSGAGINSQPVKDTATKILRFLAEQVAATPWPCAKSPERIVRYVSGLADGADQVLTGIAVDIREHNAGKTKSELVVILPCRRETYRDVSVKDRAQFEALLAQATWTLTLDADYRPDPAPHDPGSLANVPAQRTRQRSYQAQAWYLRQHADLLVAVWDPTNAFERGGTEDTIQHALRHELPVIWIDPREPECIRVLRELRDVVPGRCSTNDWRADLSQVVKRLLAFPGAPDVAEHDPPSPPSSGAELLHEFFGPALARNSFRQWFWNVGLRILHCLHWPQRCLEKPPEAMGTRPQPQSQCPPLPAPPVEPYARFKAKADANATFYAGLYRGAFMLNYLLGWLAVLFASVCLAMMAARAASDVILWIVISLGALEVLVISAVLKNVKDASDHQWHIKSINYRYLAELLRQMAFLGPLGCSTPSSRAPIQYAAHDPRQTWTSWLFRALVRASPPVATSDSETKHKVFEPLDTKRQLNIVIDCWLQEQIRHHSQNARRMGEIYETIEFLGRLFFVSVLAFIVVHVALDVGGHFGLSDGAHVWSVICLFLAIIVPAAVITLNGFRYQAECRRLKERSENMANQLGRFRDDLIELRDGAPNPDGCFSWDVAVGVHALGQVMIDEVTDWQIVYRMHEISAA